MSREISNTDDVINSRDVIARIAEIERKRDEYAETGDDWQEEYGAELTALKALADEADCTPDWQHGETLIHEAYFTEYAQHLAEDCGMIPENQGWPACHIDWEAAADALKADYFTVDFDGVTYWVRS